MRKARKWMLVFSSVIVGGALPAGRAQAAEGFSGTTVAKGRFDEFAVRAEVLPEGFGGAEADLWFAMQRTKGASDLYVQSNVWQPGGTTGWHSHPGYSLIIVTHGVITAYDGDDPTCTPHVYAAPDASGSTQASGGTLIDANHVHMVRNEGTEEATAIAVQLVPADAKRSVPATGPVPSCP